MQTKSDCLKLIVLKLILMHCVKLIMTNSSRSAVLLEGAKSGFYSYLLGGGGGGKLPPQNVNLPPPNIS